MRLGFLSPSLGMAYQAAKPQNSEHQGLLLSIGVSMSSMPWVKLYTEMLDDPKIGRLPDAIKWRFVSLVLLAGECDQDGALQASDKPMSVDDIAWRLRIPCDQCELEIESLLMCGVLELDADVYYLPKFSDRQGRPQSEKREQWRQRQARYRESKETQGKTAESVTRDSPVTNASRVDKSREEKDKEKIREDDISADKPRTPLTDTQQKVLTSFKAKRFKNDIQRDAILAWSQYPDESVSAAIIWAATKGFSLGQAIENITRALPKWNTPKRNGNGNGSTGSPMLDAILEAQKDPNYGK